MQAISCARTNGSQSCWVKANAGVKGTKTQYVGAYLFPVIQHYDANCSVCSDVPKMNLATCNDVDLEFLLFFNPEFPSVPHLIDSNITEKRGHKYNVNNAGLDGVIYMNLYGGIDYLNELYYPIPNSHCASPISFSSGSNSNNAKDCGEVFQQSLINSEKHRVKKKAEKSYCATPPIPPQQIFFQCKYDWQSCTSQSLAEASGQTQVVSVVLLSLLTILAVTFFGVPRHQDYETDLDQKESTCNQVLSAIIDLSPSGLMAAYKNYKESKENVRTSSIVDHNSINEVGVEMRNVHLTGVRI